MNGTLLPFAVAIMVLATAAGPVLRRAFAGLEQQSRPWLNGLALGALLLLVTGHLLPDAVAEHNWAALGWSLVWLLALSAIEYLGGHQHHAVASDAHGWARRIGRESLWIALYLHALADGAAVAVAVQEAAAVPLLAALVLHRFAVSLSVTVGLHSSKSMVLRLAPLALLTGAAALGLGLQLPAETLEHPLLKGLLIGGLTHLGNHSYVTHRDTDSRVHSSENIGFLTAMILLWPLLPGQLAMDGLYLLAGAGVAALVYFTVARIQGLAQQPFHCHIAVLDRHGVLRLPAALLIAPAIFYAPITLPVLLLLAVIQFRVQRPQAGDTDHMGAELPWFIIGLWAAWLTRMGGDFAFTMPWQALVVAMILLLILDLPWSFWLPLWIIPGNLPADLLFSATVLGCGFDMGYWRGLSGPRRRITALVLVLMVAGLALAGYLAGLNAHLAHPGVLLASLFAAHSRYWGILGVLLLGAIVVLNRAQLQERGIVALLAAINRLTGVTPDGNHDEHDHPHHEHSPHEHTHGVDNANHSS